MYIPSATGPRSLRVLSSKRLIFTRSYPLHYLFTRDLPNLVPALTGAASPQNCGQRLSNSQCLPSLSAPQVFKYHRPISHVRQPRSDFFFSLSRFSWVLVVVFPDPPPHSRPLLPRACLRCCSNECAARSASFARCL